MRSLPIRAAAAALIGFALLRFAQGPSFWLDEAFVAVTLRDSTFIGLFGPLEFGQYFPRLYLALVWVVRQAFGYGVHTLRFLPLACFVAGTVAWARLLERRSEPSLPASVLGGALLLATGSWLDYSTQIKQYTWDVLLALIPFSLSDALLEDVLVRGRKRARSALLAVPLALSYPYLFSLGARIAGWYLSRLRARNSRLEFRAVALLGLSILAGMGSIWLTDHQFNLGTDMTGYWRSCILGEQLRAGPVPAALLVMNFLWSWHSHMPRPVTAGIIILQALGTVSVLRRKNDSSWGSRSLGSLVLLAGIPLASLFTIYPICSGRLVLPTQIHTQIVAIEGALWVAGWTARMSPTWRRLLAWPIPVVISAFSLSFFARHARLEPIENIAALVPAMDRKESDFAWVHPCAVAGVRALPDPLPVAEVVLGNEQTPPPRGRKVWILWTHPGEACNQVLEGVRKSALSWETRAQGLDRGLALAEF